MLDPARARSGGAPFGIDVGLAWLLRLRWGAAVAELAVILLTHYGLHIRLRIAPLVALVCVTIATSLTFGPRARRGDASAPLIGGLLLLDVLTLTGLLFLSGGASNPFSALYFVYVSLASVVLGGGWAWAVLALSILCFSTLFLGSVPVPALGDHTHHDVAGGFSAHLEGMFLAFAVAAGLIAYFVTRLQEAFRDREVELERVRERALASEKVAALTTLAAGAAHELGTPLGTIAVVAKELEHGLARLEGAEGAIDDARLIRSEVMRCRGILDSMSARAGEEVGEAPCVTSTAALLEALRARLGPAAGRLEVDDLEGSLRVPPRAFVQMLSNVVINALQASEGPVRLGIAREGGRARVSVVDGGPGMTAEVRDRATEPFFTTKEAGRGMGLGLFLARTVAERLGGTLQIDSELGRGTTVTITLPEAFA